MLNDILFQFLNSIAAGYGNILPFAESLLYYMIVFEILLLSFMWMLGVGNVAVDAIRKILVIGFFTYLIFNFPQFMKMVIDSMIKAGLVAGGGNFSLSNFLNPSDMVDHGIRISNHILENLPVSSFFSGKAAVMGLCALAIVVSFIVIAIQIIKTFIEFYMLSVVGVLLLPFGVFRHTAFLAEKTFGMMVGFAVKLLVLSFIVSLIDPVVSTLDVTDPNKELEWASIVVTMCVAILIAILAWNIPAVAAAMLTGGPSLTAGTAIAGTMAGAMGVAAGGMAALSAARTAGSAMVGATKAAAGVSTAATMGAATAATGGAGVVGQAGAALKGAASYAGGAATSKASDIAQGFKDAVKQGRLRGYERTGGTATPGMARHAQPSAPSNGNTPHWAQQIISAGYYARHSLPPEAQPHGSSTAPLKTK